VDKERTTKSTKEKDFDRIYKICRVDV